MSLVNTLDYHYLSIKKKESAEIIYKSFTTTGFLFLSNTGLARMLEEFETPRANFFGKSQKIKDSYIMNNQGQSGYTQLRKESAKGLNYFDNKEFWQFHQPANDNDPITWEYPDNPDCKECPEFTRLGMKIHEAFGIRFKILMRAIAISLNLPEFYFDEKIEDGKSIFRSLHYPPIKEAPPVGEDRAGAHEDINLVTLLAGASTGGLQLQTLDGVWHDILPKKGDLVVNVGDMLQNFTNKIYKSTTHRVVYPPKSEWMHSRYSIPYFGHPLGDMDLTPLAQWRESGLEDGVREINADSYLKERLAEIAKAS